MEACAPPTKPPSRSASIPGTGNGALVAEAAITLKSLNAIPFAGACTDPCDGRTQGTTGMLDSLPYRNDAAIVLRRLMRSLPTRMGVIGIATCDKGLPAMMMALAAAGPLPTILMSGGYSSRSGEDAGKVQTIGARYAQKQITLETAAEMGCRACATPGGGCQFLGTAATAQVIAEALGLALPHTALAVRRTHLARRSPPLRCRHPAPARVAPRHPGHHHPGLDRKRHGGSCRFRWIHQPVAPSPGDCLAGLKRPVATDWASINRTVPRLVDALPNGPRNYATVQLLAGGLPEVMLHLRRAGLLNTKAKTVSGETLTPASTGGKTALAATRCAKISWIATASIPTTSLWMPIAPAPTASPPPYVSSREPGPGRLRGQEHVD